MVSVECRSLSWSPQRLTVPITLRRFVFLLTAGGGAQILWTIGVMFSTTPWLFWVHHRDTWHFTKIEWISSKSVHFLLDHHSVKQYNKNLSKPNRAESKIYQNLFFMFLWPCIVSKIWRKKTNKMQQSDVFINFCLNMFRASLCPSSGEQRPCYCIWCVVLVLLDVVGSGCGGAAL